MKSQKVEALDVIEEDLRYAWVYYDSWHADGSSYFQEQFRDTVKWTVWNPELFPKRYKFFRRAVIRSTFFGIFYAIEPDIHRFGIHMHPACRIAASHPHRANPHMNPTSPDQAL